MKINVKIKEFRKKKGLNQQQLADAMNLHQTTISDYEHGKALPSLTRAVEMAAILEVTLDEFIQFDKLHTEYSKELAELGKSED